MCVEPKKKDALFFIIFYDFVNNEWGSNYGKSIRDTINNEISNINNVYYKT